MAVAPVAIMDARYTVNYLNTLLVAISTALSAGCHSADVAWYVAEYNDAFGWLVAVTQGFAVATPLSVEGVLHGREYVVGLKEVLQCV